MKKLVAFACAGLMAVSLMTGCGKSDDAGKDTEKGGEITIAALNGGYGEEGWKKVAAAFEEETGVKVNLTIKSNISEVIRPEIQAGNVPDVIYYSIGQPDGFTEAMIKDNAILEISDFTDWEIPGEAGVKVSDKLLSGFAETTKTKPYSDGKTYLAPVFYSPTGLFYNSELIGEGKKYEMPKTWDEMFALGDKAKADGVSLFTTPTTGYLDSFFYALLTQQAGLDGYAKAMNYEGLDSEGATKAFEIMGKLATYVEPSTLANGNSENYKKNQQLVVDDKAMYMPNGNWVIDEMKDATATKEEGTFNWGFTTLPKNNADDATVAYSFFEQVYIPKAAKNADAAKQFVAYMYSDKAAQIFAENGNAVMPTKTAASNLKDDSVKMFYNTITEDTIVAMDAFNASKSVEGVMIADEIFTNYSNVIEGKTSVADWQKAIVEAANKLHDAK